MTLIANLPQRQPSRAARWALRLALLTPALAVIAILAHRGGLVETPSFLSMAAMLAALCVLTLLLILGGLRSLWVHGKKGGRRLSWALFFILPVIIPFAWAGYLWFTHPATSDISTDLSDPPVFAAELAAGADLPRAAGGEASAPARQIAGQRFNAALDPLLGAVQSVAEARGWTEIGRRGRIGADDAIFVQYRYNTPILHMPVEIVVRIVDEGDSSFIDMRARMPHVDHDLGATVRLIEQAMADIDFAMIGLTDS